MVDSGVAGLSGSGMGSTFGSAVSRGGGVGGAPSSCGAWAVATTSTGPAASVVVGAASGAASAAASVGFDASAAAVTVARTAGSTGSFAPDFWKVSGTEFQFRLDLIARCKGYWAIFHCIEPVVLLKSHFSSLRRALYRVLSMVFKAE